MQAIGWGLISSTLATGHYPALTPSSETLLHTDLTHTWQSLASFLYGALQCPAWEMAPALVFSKLPDTEGEDKVSPALAGESSPLFTKHLLCVQPSVNTDLIPRTKKLGSFICAIGKPEAHRGAGSSLKPLSQSLQKLGTKGDWCAH